MTTQNCKSSFLLFASEDVREGRKLFTTGNYLLNNPARHLLVAVEAQRNGGWYGYQEEMHLIIIIFLVCTIKQARRSGFRCGWRMLIATALRW